MMQAKQENTLGTQTKLEDMKGMYCIFAKMYTERKQSKQKQKPETEIVYI